VKYILFLSFLFILFTGCSAKHQELKTVQKVDVNKYLGTWYEIARYDNFFEKGCSDISATYSLRKDGKINVENKCTKDGKIDIAIGEAYNIDESFSKLKVSFFWPFYGNYQIIMLDEKYSYVVIGEPKREYFWILSRTSILDEKILIEILQKMPSYGYSKDKLIYPKHNHNN